jgi:hypothetical protein
MMMIAARAGRPSGLTADAHCSFKCRGPASYERQRRTFERLAPETILGNELGLIGAAREFLAALDDGRYDYQASSDTVLPFAPRPQTSGERTAGSPLPDSHTHNFKEF